MKLLISKPRQPAKQWPALPQSPLASCGDDSDETMQRDRPPSRTMPCLSLFRALEHEWRGRTRLFPSALDGRPLRIELAIECACAVAYFEMQVHLVDRNRIDEKVSNASAEEVGSSDEVLVVRIRPNMYSQLKRPFLPNHLALPIAQHAGRELVGRKRSLEAVSPISFPILAWIIHRPGSPRRDFAAEIELHDVKRQVYPGAGRPGCEDYWIALHPTPIADEVDIRVFPLNVRIGSIHGRCRLAGEHTRCSQLIGTYADSHYDVTAFRHLSNPIQHL